MKSQRNFYFSRIGQLGRSVVASGQRLLDPLLSRLRAVEVAAPARVPVRSSILTMHTRARDSGIVPICFPPRSSVRQEPGDPSDERARCHDADVHVHVREPRRPQEGRDLTHTVRDYQRTRERYEPTDTPSPKRTK